MLRRSSELRRSSYTRALTASIVAAALVGTGVTGAVAGEDPTETAAKLIADVAPFQGQVVAGSESGGEITAQVDQSVVVVPLSAERSITLGDAAGQAPSLELNLPKELDVHDGKTADDGTVVYRQVGGDAAAAVQVLDDGAVRVQTITPDESGPHQFTYTFGEGITPVEAEGGTIELVRAVEGSPLRQIVGVVDEPWALDADGRSVPTAYTITGDALQQTLDPDESTAYPIVADPRVSVGVGVYLYLNRIEANATAAVSESVLRVGAGATCAVYGNRITVPGVKQLVQHLCGFVSAGAIYQYFNTLPAAMKSWPNRACYEFRYFNGWHTKSVSSSLCTPLNKSFAWV